MALLCIIRDMGNPNVFSELSQRAGLAQKVFVEAVKGDLRRAKIVTDIAQSAVEKLEQVTDPVEAQKLATRFKIRGVLEIAAGIGIFKLGEHFVGGFGNQQEIKDVILWLVTALVALMPVVDGIQCFLRARQAKILSVDIMDVLRKEKQQSFDS